MDYLKAIIAEEGERNRRIAEEIGNPFEEEIVREITRRETWLEEERERARRILETEQSEIENAVVCGSSTQMTKFLVETLT